MLGSLGMPELLVILVVVMLIFGPRQLPKMGRALGETIKEFRGVGKELNALHDEDEPSDEEKIRATRAVLASMKGQVPIATKINREYDTRV